MPDLAIYNDGDRVTIVACNLAALKWLWSAREGDGIAKVVAEYLNSHAASAGLVIEVRS